MSEIFDEKHMYEILKPYAPKGEAIVAAVHANAKEAKIITHFKNCVVIGDQVVPLVSDAMTQLHQKVVDTPGENTILEVVKKKYCVFSVYVALTKSHLLIVPCEPCSWYYQIENIDERFGIKTIEPAQALNLSDVGYCFSLSDFTQLESKTIWFGAVNATLRLKNGSYFKLQFPKRAGIGNGMPHQLEHRNQILSRLGHI